MPAQISAVDSSQTITPVSRNAGKAAPGSSFEALMAQLTQATHGKGRAAAGQTSTASTGGNYVTTSYGQATQETSIKTLEKSLRASGQLLEGMQVASSDRGKLESRCCCSRATARRTCASFWSAAQTRTKASTSERSSQSFPVPAPSRLPAAVQPRRRSPADPGAQGFGPGLWQGAGVHGQPAQAG